MQRRDRQYRVALHSRGARARAVQAAHLGSRRNRHRASGHRPAVFADALDKTEHQIAARRLSRKNNARCLESKVQQRAVGALTIIQCCGKLAGGCEPVVHQEAHRIELAAQLAQQAGMRIGRRRQNESAAMDIENHGLSRIGQIAHHMAGYAAHNAILDRQAAGIAAGARRHQQLHPRNPFQRPAHHPGQPGPKQPAHQPDDKAAAPADVDCLQPQQPFACRGRQCLLLVFDAAGGFHFDGPTLKRRRAGASSFQASRAAEAWPVIGISLAPLQATFPDRGGHPPLPEPARGVSPRSRGCATAAR